MMDVHRAIAEGLATTLKPIDGHKTKVWNNGSLWCVSFIDERYYDKFEAPGTVCAATIFIGPELNVHYRQGIPLRRPNASRTHPGLY
jgi:hypothetical protein